MQFSAVLNIFIVKTMLNSTFTNDLKRKENFSKNVHSYRVCSFNIQRSIIIGGTQIITNKRKIHLFDKIIHFFMQFSAVLNISIVKT